MINEAHIVPYETRVLPIDEGPWLVFAPHPDDETFGMGGTISKAAALGIQITPTIMTNGSQGGGMAHLVSVREREAKQASSFLGINTPIFLGNQDRELAMSQAVIEQVKNEIIAAAPRAVFFPGPFELHPDHRVTAQIVWAALAQLSEIGATFHNVNAFSYEILVQSPVNTLVDITACLREKRLAISAYRSQLTEKNYENISLAMNELRSLTLQSEVTHAEGFYHFSEEERKKSLADIFVGKITSYF